MCVKGYIKIRLQRLVFHLKSSAAAVIITAAAISALLPAYLIAINMQENSYNAAVKSCEALFVVLPLFAPVMIIFASKEYTESEGCEVFSFSSKQRYSDMLLLFLPYLLNAAVILCVVVSVYPVLKLACVWIIVILLFIFTASYFILYAFSTMTFAVMLHLIYIFSNIIVSKLLNIFPFFFCAAGYDFIGEFSTVYAPMLFFTILLTIFNLRLSHFSSAFKLK